jgi:putative nucleotidyltransferase with HDIG domain
MLDIERLRGYPRGAPMSPARQTKSSLAVAVVGLAAALIWFALTADDRLLDPLTPALVAGAIAANALSVRYDATMWVSASFTCSIVAVAVLGPAAAFLVVALGELGTLAFERIRAYAVVGNILSGGVPSLVAGSLFVLVAAPDTEPVPTIAALALAAMLWLTLSYAIARLLSAPTLREGLRGSLRIPNPVVPALLWAVLVATGVAQLYEHMPEAGAAGLALTLLGVTYMLQLVAAARQRKTASPVNEQRVIEDLLSALRERDPESARHAAAVARFARDVATALDMTEEERRVAHSAGLLHDLGRLTLSDVALGAKGELSEREWSAIQRHPEAGASMLRSLGFEPPVIDAVAAHHERPDGRGYPKGLRDGQIPQLANVVAVAEVYDTLIAGSAYRPALSSFQALTELRRVAGTQLDQDCVGALASVLAHRPLDERLATGADVDSELALARALIPTAPS